MNKRNYRIKNGIISHVPLLDYAYFFNFQISAYLKHYLSS